MVHIQGMIENHILAARPSDTRDGLILKLLEQAEDQSTIDLLKMPGFRIQHNMTCSAYLTTVIEYTGFFFV